MGVKLQLVLGVVLVFSICGCSTSSSNFRQVRQVIDNSTTSTTPQNVDSDKTERHVNLIEKLPKTENELKTVNTNTQKNFTSVKLSKSEPYIKVSDTNTTKNEEITNAVEKEQLEDKENIIKQDSSEKTRDENSRSIDLDIKKYVSPDFHIKNNVFTVPISSDTEKYIDKIFEHKSSTPKLTDFSKLELTTPKTDYFDNKYKEAVQSIDQKLEHIDDGEDEDEEVNAEDHLKQMPVEQLIEEYRTTPNSNLDYKELKNVVQHNNEDKNSTHKDTTVEQVKKLNFESSFNDTVTYNDDDDKHQKGDPEIFETTSPKNNFILTTRKSIALTKPPTNKNNSYILSNKIETETLKAINIITTELPTTKINKNDEENLTTADGTERSKRKDDNVQENQIISTETTTPGTTTESLTTTEEPGTTTVRVYNQYTTISEDSATNNVEVTTTADESTTSNIGTTEVFTTDGITEKLTTEQTTRFEQRTEPPPSEEPTTLFERGSTLTPSEILTTTEYEISTTSREELTTVMLEGLKLLETTTETVSTEGTTFEAREISTTFRNDDETTQTQMRTTVKGFRTSKGMAFEDLTTTEGRTRTESTTEVKTTTDGITTTDGKTTEGKITTDGIAAAGKIITDEIATEGKVTTNEIATDGKVTTDVRTVTETTTFETTKYVDLDITSTPKIADNTTPIPFVIHTSTVTPLITTFAPTIEITTITHNQATANIPFETTQDRYKIPTTIKTTSTSTVDFVHIENISGKQTTLPPETLSPSFSYPTPDIVKPVENKMVVEDSTVVPTTTETSDTPSTDNSIGDSNDKKGTIAAIVISTVGAVCLVALAGLLYIMRKRQKRFNYGQRCRPVGLDDYSMDNVSVYNSGRRKYALRQSKRSYGNPAFEDPVAVTHPLNFPALAKFANNTDDLKAEFEEVPQIAAKTSELPEGCEIKNRYANVIPLPETRVFLKPIEGYPNSDYINANYVTGPKETKGYYIACQAPLQNTVDDFWRMIWEQQSKVILMLTHLFENGVEKCIDYLPPSEVLDCHRLFGDFQVTLKKREVKDKYIISSLQLKNMVSNSWREVTHFWYMGWPEKGVPSEGNSLIAFLIEARSFMKTATLDKNAAANGNIQNGTAHNEVNPVVVHCSPGTGRTGVVIACDIAIREFEQSRLVDIPRIVYRIRRDRASAVQTKEQYIFIYKVVSLYATKLTGGALDSL